MELNKLRLIVPFDSNDMKKTSEAEKPSRAHHERGCGAQIVDFIKSSLSDFCGQRRPNKQQRRRKRGSVSFHDTDGTGLREKEVNGSENARIFTYSELYIGTNGFSETELLGSGGFGRVYKAVLPSDGATVAVKCVAEEGERFEKSFAAELLAVAHLRHRNLVRLRGWCVDDSRLLLVYDYMPNRSLDRALFRRAEPPMGWRRRKKIVEGLAAALHYLHDNLETQIVHRDVKASNVMLDSGYNARLGDFGLARWLEHDPDLTASESEISSGSTTFRLSDRSRVGGTIGYLPPEAFRRKASAVTATAKSDVFSFGIVALEVASGRRAVELSCPDDEIVLLDWLRNLSDSGNVLRAADPRLVGTAVPRDEIERLIHVALLCTLNSPISRPTMKWTAEALSGSLSGGLPPLPSFKPHPKYITISSSPSATTTTATFSSVTSSGYVTAVEETLYATVEDDSSAAGAATGSSRIGSVRRIFPTVQTPSEISYAEIEEATNGFSDSRRVAELDFGSAYRGVIGGGSGPEVLIKRLGMKTCPALRVRFSAELQNLGRLRHRNLVQLRGWCTERGEMLVVYDYSPSRLLAIALPTLHWRARYEIAKSLASAVRYLHEEWEETVVHRNITSSAVVLDPGSDSPRLGSFALAEFLTRNANGHHVADAKPARGIFGYMAPEYLDSGEATTAVDVYGFGVVVLEVVTGESAVDFRRPEALLPARVRGFLARKRAVEGLADARLEGEWDPKEMARLLRLGVACTASDPGSRPTMTEIVRILDGNDDWFVDKARKKESVDQWKQANASSLSLVNRVQALGLQ